MLLVLLEHLRRSLTKVIDLALIRFLQNFILESLQIYAILIAEEREGVEALLRFRISLLAAKDIVDPASQVHGDILGFKHFPQLHHKQVRVFFSPRWDLHMIHFLVILPKAKVCMVSV